MEFLGMTLTSKECDPNATPYYMQSETICYDICPDHYYEDSTNWLCKPCIASAYACRKCLVNGTCTLCDNTTDFRVLNTSTGKCDPLPGYYNTGVAIAAQCNSNCLNCSVTSINCTACHPA